ncbi:hypothetical protein Tco_0783583 [Tanacetum coccineum]
MWGEEFNFSGDELPVKDSMGPVVTTPTPDGNLNYNDLVALSKLDPDDEFFPETINTDSSDMLVMIVDLWES